MSIYNFAPMPQANIGASPFVTWEDGFTLQEIDEIVQAGEAKVSERGQAGGTVSDYRRSNIAWLSYNDIPFLYDRMAHIARNLNAQFYRFDLSGFHEDMQYTVYNGEEEGHYDWHIDQMADGQVPRKFSLVLQLSDPYEYEGGDLEIITSKNPIAVTKRKGLVAAFPSYVMHRVTPVTSGTRRTLVVWCCGPPFR